MIFSLILLDERFLIFVHFSGISIQSHLQRSCKTSMGTDRQPQKETERRLESDLERLKSALRKQPSSSSADEATRPKSHAFNGRPTVDQKLIIDRHHMPNCSSNNTSAALNNPSTLINDTKGTTAKAMRKYSASEFNNQSNTSEGASKKTSSNASNSNHGIRSRNSSGNSDIVYPPMSFYEESMDPENYSPIPPALRFVSEIQSRDIKGNLPTTHGLPTYPVKSTFKYTSNATPGSNLSSKSKTELGGTSGATQSSSLIGTGQADGKMDDVSESANFDSRSASMRYQNTKL